MDYIQLLIILPKWTNKLYAICLLFFRLIFWICNRANVSLIWIYLFIQWLKKRKTLAGLFACLFFLCDTNNFTEPNSNWYSKQMIFFSNVGPSCASVFNKKEIHPFIVWLMRWSKCVLMHIRKPLSSGVVHIMCCVGVLRTLLLASPIYMCVQYIYRHCTAAINVRCTYVTDWNYFLFPQRSKIQTHSWIMFR